ncbi:hypothetical protein BDR07DRAFT_1481538 [Suillus spraguei]|nr:hypothetical protein BDR07DRAFT_1481538 [Suillus spraguei]
MLDTDLDDDTSLNDLENNRRYRSYKKLANWCPSIHKLVHSVVENDELSYVYSKSNKGADGARADDTTQLKVTVASWLMQQTPPPSTVIHGQNKLGLGFNNDTTGRLLFPVNYDWNDPVVQQGIRDYHPDYHTFKYIFTSPTSMEMDDQEQLNPEVLPFQGCPKQLLNMQSVQAQSIAYAAVQLRFALSSTGSWHIVDDEFDHQEFYDNIVDFLELAVTSDIAREVEDLLLWWNCKIFRCKHVSTYRPQRVEQLSVARCLARH